jgi:hypothetical protein
LADEGYCAVLPPLLSEDRGMIRTAPEAHSLGFGGSVVIDVKPDVESGRETDRI